MPKQPFLTGEVLYCHWSVIVLLVALIILFLLAVLLTWTQSNSNFYLLTVWSWHLGVYVQPIRVKQETARCNSTSRGKGSLHHNVIAAFVVHKIVIVFGNLVAVGLCENIVFENSLVSCMCFWIIFL